jgi:hypothetical protein
MNGISFSDRVKKHFQYLESEYDFKISREGISEIHPQTDGVVEYSSHTTVIVIDSEMGSVSLWFYRIKDGKKYYLDPVSIHEYMNTSNEEKGLLLSTNPRDQLAASILSNQKFLLNQPGWKSNENITEAKLEKRLVNYANWLKTHANLCLQGNFSLWPKFYEYKIQRARAENFRRGEDDLVYVRVKDTDGNYKLIKQSQYKDELEHIEQLKKEFYS